MKDRLKVFMKKYGVNAKQLSEQIGVQPSSISHILTGRNKPSIDLVEKLITVYPNLNLKWLIAGIDEMELSEAKNLQENQPKMEPIPTPKANKVVIFYDDGRFEELVSNDKSSVD